MRITIIKVPVMEKVHISPTNKTPEYLLDPKGIIKIKGRAIDETRTGIPEQVMNWIDAYLLGPSESTEVTVALDRKSTRLNSSHT